jgi:hypothetical protein
MSAEAQKGSTMMRADTVRILSDQATSRRLYRMEVEKRDDGGETRRSVPDGEEEIRFDVFLDRHALAAMARKAAGSNAGKSRDGALMVQVIAKRKTAAR